MAKPFEDQIRSAARSAGIDETLFLAICQVESGLIPWRMRYEPAWSYLYFPREYAEQLGISVDTETELQKFSFGLCQIMGSVVREMGFSGHLSQLMADVRIPLQYGARKIREIMERYGSDEAVIAAAYNGGSPRKTAGGLFENQRYCDAVHSAILSLRIDPGAVPGESNGEGATTT